TSSAMTPSRRTIPYHIEWCCSASQQTGSPNIGVHSCEVRFTPKADIMAAQQKGACRGFAGYLLLFDPVQAPPLGHAFESVNAAILKADSRLRHQILDRARNQDLTGTRFRGDARADVKRETDHVSPIHFVFACVQPHPDL